ncbi:MAG: HEAT repeat domain-containing protein [Thermodesulfobacteriota bacterium]
MAWFFRSKLKHPDEQVRLRALQKLTDPNKIIQVACEDDSPTVRLEAVRKLSDPNHLAKVVKEGKGLEARVQAVGRIQDQSLLARILLERKNNDIMQAAFENLTDPEVLKVIAEDSRYNIATRRIAIENFADQSFLEDVARNVTTPGVREAALKRLSEEGAAVPTASTPEAPEGEAPDPEHIDAILERYGAERIIAAIGKFRGSEKAIRSLGLIAGKGIEGSELAIHFLEKALDHSNPHIRVCALEEMADALTRDKLEPILANARKDPDPTVREAANRIRTSGENS